MADSAQGPSVEGEQATQEMPPVAGTPASDSFAERPEIFVGAAFAGGIVLAKVLKRLGR